MVVSYDISQADDWEEVYSNTFNSTNVQGQATKVYTPIPPTELTVNLDTQKAYILATVQHETAGTYQPVKEAYWNSEEWREDNLRYFPYYGRGYVQLTWEFNYQTYTQLLGMDLVSSPDSALIPEIAMYILCHGFKYGMFTGRKLEDYVNESKTDFLNARRCINGMDKHLQIAELAKKHLHYLRTDNRYSA